LKQIYGARSKYVHAGKPFPAQIGPGLRARVPGGGYDRDDAERFQAELRDRLAQFALTLHPDKTRLIQFGRRAADDRNQTGLGKPQTFDFLGSTMVTGLACHTP
jgi:hypothetical protein